MEKIVSFRKMRNGSLFILWAIMLMGLAGFTMSPVYAMEVTLEWDKPEATTDFDGYKIYYVEDSPDFDRAEVAKVRDPHQTTLDISGLEEGGVYYFAASTYKENGSDVDYESELSGAITHLLPGEYTGDAGGTGGGGGGGGGGGCFIGVSSMSAE